MFKIADGLDMHAGPFGQIRLAQSARALAAPIARLL